MTGTPDPTCPHVSLHLVVMKAAAGDEVRRARRARGLSQQQLARETGVSAKTIGRIERGESDEAHKLGTVQAYLGIGEYAGEPDEGPNLRAATNIQLAVELLRRLEAAESGESATFPAPGTLPPEIVNEPGTVAGPPAGQSGKGVQTGG